MPGAWEMPRPNVLVATLTRETCSVKWAANHRNMQLPPNSACSYLSGMPFDHARNTAVENMLKNGFEWLFFVDDDVCIPADTVQRLMAHGKDIISGVYYRRAPPIVPCMLRYKSPTEAEWITAWNPPGALIEVDLVGAGCLLVHRRVFERMAEKMGEDRKWFLWELDKPGVPEPRHSEDFSFCRNAKRVHGFGVWVDTSVMCEHVGFGASSGQQGAVFQPAGV